MAKEPKHRHLKATILVLSLLSPFVVLSSAMNPWSSKFSLGPLLQELVYPVEYIWHRSVSTASRNWQKYFDLSEAATENLHLRRELALIQTRLLDYDEQLQETRRLRDLLGFTQRYATNHLVAEVIGRTSALPYQSIRITKGETDGVQVGMPVVTNEGIVGRILRAGLGFSDVQLLTDSNFSIDVLLQRTRVRGVLHGYADNSCQLLLNRRAEIRIGDMVITSGIVGAFPKGLPIGRVMRISYESDNISQLITVEPWVDHRRLDEVVVLQETNKELQKITETAGTNWLEKSLRTQQ